LQGGFEPSWHTTVVPLFGGTTTVVFAGGGGLLLLMHADIETNEIAQMAARRAFIRNPLA
jgi:hypothetical protein